MSTRYKVERIALGEDSYWLVSDFQGRIVAQCSKKHNAQLICKLLNEHT